MKTLVVDLLAEDIKHNLPNWLVEGRQIKEKQKISEWLAARRTEKAAFHRKWGTLATFGEWNEDDHPRDADGKFTNGISNAESTAGSFAPPPGVERKLLDLPDIVNGNGNALPWDATVKGLTDQQRAIAIKNTEIATRVLEVEIKAQLTHEATERAAGRSAYDSTKWYSDKAKEGVDIAKQVVPEIGKSAADSALFSVMLGVMSDGTTPFNAYSQAIRLARAYYDNDEKFPLTNPTNGKQWGKDAVGATIDGINKMSKELGGTAAALAWLSSVHTNAELNAAVQKWRGTSGMSDGLNAIKRANELNPGFLILGPKIGRFAANLRGFEDLATVDRWASRGHDRLFRSLNLKDKGSKSHSDAPTQHKRQHTESMYRAVGAKLGLTTAKVQAIAWANESRLYANLGVPQNGNVGDFADAGRRVVALNSKGKFKFSDGDVMSFSDEPFTDEELRGMRLLALLMADELGLPPNTKYERAMFEYDESQHPRAEDGKWTDGEGSVHALYDISKDGKLSWGSKDGMAATPFTPAKVTAVEFLRKTLKFSGFVEFKSQTEINRELDADDAGMKNATPLAYYNSDANSITVSRDFVEEATDGMVQGVLRHEVFHAKFFHAMESQPEVASLVTDYVRPRMPELALVGSKVSPYAAMVWESSGNAVVSMAPKAAGWVTQYAVNETMAEIERTGAWKDPAYKHYANIKKAMKIK